MIRFFCTVRSQPSYWGDLGFAFFELFGRMGYEIRVLPIGAGDVGSTSSRWAAHTADFVRPIVGKDFVNVVCADGEPLVFLHTVGVPNIAITDRLRAPSEKEVVALLAYDMVICPSADGVELLRQDGVFAFHVSPTDAFQLTRAMEAL